MLHAILHVLSVPTKSIRARKRLPAAVTPASVSPDDARDRPSHRASPRNDGHSGSACSESLRLYQLLHNPKTPRPGRATITGDLQGTQDDFVGRYAKACHVLLHAQPTCKHALAKTGWA